MTNQIDVLQGYTNDMLAVEREVAAAFTRQAEDHRVRRNPTVAQLIARAIEILERHITDLQDCQQRLGGSESVVKKTVGAVLGVAAGLYDKVRLDDQVSRMLRDDYTALTFACVCYEMLHTTALAMKDVRLADMTLAHLRDLTPLVMDIGELLPGVLTDELTAQGKAATDRSAVELSIRNVRDAWAQGAAAHH